MLKFFRVPFALSGNKTPIPDSADPNGYVSYIEGYGPDYQRPKADALSKNIERDKQNQLFYDTTAAIGELQAQGVPDFITSALNGGSSFNYAKNAIVRHSDGNLYVSLVANNVAQPSDATKWAGLTGQAVSEFTRVVSNIAALRVAAVFRTRVQVAGYYTPGDGGGGLYYLDTSDTTSADNGGTIIVASDGGRWKLILTGPVSVKQFGAKGNYTGGSIVGQDDTAAIQACINWVQANTNSVSYGSYSPSVGTGVVYFPQGSYGVSASLAVTVKLCIMGEGQTEYTYGSRLTQTAANADLFQISASAGSTSFSIENMVLRHNTAAGTGHLVNMVRSGGGTVNSQRYVNCTFAQPAAKALYLAGDDIVIKNCLFDVSTVSGDAIQLGTSTMGASNVRIEGCDFFNCTNSCVKLVNIEGLVWAANEVSQPNTTTKTLRVFDAISTAPTLATNISISGGVIKGPRTLFGGNSVTNLVINGLTVVQGGIGAGEVNHMMTFTGNCSVNISGNTFRGTYDTANFYNDAGATNVFGFIGGNTFGNDGGTGDALSCTKFVGTIARSNYNGFVARQVGEKRATSGSPVNPGAIGAGLTFGYALTVSGATFGDSVNVGTISNAWVAQTGIDVRAFVNAANTVRIEYRNVTAGSITVAAHDVWAEVTR